MGFPIEAEEINSVAAEKEDVDLPKSSGFKIPIALYVLIHVTGILLILTVGLVCGIVVRKNNCIETLSVSTSTTTTSTTTISTTTTKASSINYAVNLKNLAYLRSNQANLASKEIYGSVINVSVIENEVIAFYRSKYQAYNIEILWRSYSPYLMSVKFMFNSTNLYTIESLAKDFLEQAFDKVFSADNTPIGYSAYKSELKAILVDSECSSCAPSPSTTTSQSVTSGNSLSDSVRLPDYFLPESYDLTLRAFFKPSTNQADDSVATNYYTGRVEILFRLSKSTNFVLFHADSSLNLKSVELYDENYSVAGLVSTSGNLTMLDYQLVRVNINGQIGIGKYKLVIEFSGDYGPSSNLVGFYRTKYTENGIIYSVLGSKFQPTYARNAFPCFDEPALKATYSITIEHPEGSYSVSNWPVKSKTNITVNNQKRIKTSFEITYKMSSYLAAWAILPESNFGYKEAFTQRGIPVRVYARQQAIDSGLIDFAVNITKFSTDYFQNVYFDSSLRALPPKIDMIGFPDFPSGAMEHWGIVGFRESNLFYSDSKNSLSNKQSVAFVISHEIAHFWFGNLVTCKWWDDLWLNEAMARFLQFKAVDYIFPEWNVNDQFITQYLIPVMYDDGYPSSSHPVSATVVTPAEINTLFDSITYDKGSSLLRMLESTVSPSNFQSGLNNYLLNNQEGASEAADFYALLKLPAIMSQNNVTAQQYMENWLLQINYPQVSIELLANSQTTVSFKQSRFVLDNADVDPNYGIVSPFGYKWLIYLQCKAGNSQGTDVMDFEFFLNKNDGVLTLNNPYSWVKCNNNFRGYYVNKYPLEIFKRIANVLNKKPEVFSIGDRANLIHNAYAQAIVPFNTYEMTGLLTSYLKNLETDYVPWRVFTWHITKLASILDHRASFINLRDFGSELIRSLFYKLNIWDDSGSHVQRLLKSNLVDFLCRMQDQDCLQNATKMFRSLDQDYFNKPNDVNNNIPPNIRGSVYKYHVQNTNSYDDWYYLAQVYGLTVDPQERTILLDALANSRLHWTIDSVCLECSWTNSNLTVINVRPQDFFTFLTYVGRNANGRHYAWYFIRHYWPELVKRFGLTNRSFANALKSICETFENEFLFLEMEVFFALNEAGTGSLQRSQALEIVINNIAFLWNNKESSLEQYLYSSF